MSRDERPQSPWPRAPCSGSATPAMSHIWVEAVNMGDGSGPRERRGRRKPTLSWPSPPPHVDAKPWVSLRHESTGRRDGDLAATDHTGLCPTRLWWWRWGGQGRRDVTEEKRSSARVARRDDAGAKDRLFLN